MKTITPKNAFKLFLFLLILFSAKAISHPKLPKDSNSSECESRIGCVSKTNKQKLTTTTTASARGNSIQSKNMALKNSLTPRVSLKKQP